MAEGTKINISRRRFLEIAGAVAGSAAVPSVLFAMGRDGDVASVDLPPLKIGVLLPSSGMYLALPQNIMAGMRLSAERMLGRQKAGRITFVTEDIGTGQTLAEIGAKKLIDEDRVDIIIGYVNAAVASSLHPVFRNAEIPFVSANMGEYMPREQDADPSIFSSTLQYWQTHWSMGAWAAQNIGKSAFIASSLYDSGYDSSFAFQSGFESAGGSIAGRSLAMAAHDPSEVIREIRKAGPELVYGLYCGKEAVDFAKAYAGSGLSREIALAASGFFTDEENLRQIGGASIGIKTCFSWSRDLEITENLKFRGAYESANMRKADAFALLGFDTAGVLLSALHKTEGKTNDRDALKKAISSVSLAGPRGGIKIDAGTMSVTGPLYIREVRMEHGRAVNRPVAAVNTVSGLDPHLKSMRTAMRTGWHNAYMCV